MAIVNYTSMSPSWTATGTGYSGSTMPVGVSDPDVARQIAGQEQVARIGIQPAMGNLAFQREKFGTVWPFMTNTLFPFAEGAFNTVAGKIPGQAGAGGGYGGPSIGTGGVYNPQQIQQLVNSSNAKGNAWMNAQNQQNANQFAGGGFGANSPAQMAQRNATGASAYGSNVGNETNLRTTAAQQNAQQQLQGQTAYANAFNTYRGQSLGTMNALLNMMGGMFNFNIG